MLGCGIWSVAMVTLHTKETFRPATVEPTEVTLNIGSGRAKEKSNNILDLIVKDKPVILRLVVASVDDGSIRV